jgi:hypothetical protein
VIFVPIFARCEHRLDKLNNNVLVASVVLIEPHREAIGSKPELPDI